MEIASITATPFSIALRHPQTFASGSLSAAEHVLVEVVTEDGVSGFGEAIPRPMVYGETLASVTHAIERLIAPALIGSRLTDRAAMRHELRHLVGNPTARSAVELAAFDALGRTLGVPCHRLLGGFTDSVACTAILHDAPLEAVVADARSVQEETGVASFKVKVGMDLSRDIALLEALRAQLGDDARLYCDGNCGYTLAEATRFADATKDLGLVCIEEPVPTGGALGRQRLTEHSRTPIMGDESCPDLASVTRELLASRCTMVAIKVARTAILASEEIRAFCAATGTDVIVASQGDSAIGMLANAAFAASSPITCTHPAELMFFLELTDNLVSDVPPIRAGRMALPDAPGFGYAVDRERLRKYEIPRSAP